MIGNLMFKLRETMRTLEGLTSNSEGTLLARKAARNLSKYALDLEEAYKGGNVSEGRAARGHIEAQRGLNDLILDVDGDRAGHEQRMRDIAVNAALGTKAHHHWWVEKTHKIGDFGTYSWQECHHCGQSRRRFRREPDVCPDRQVVREPLKSCVIREPAEEHVWGYVVRDGDYDRRHCTKCPASLQWKR